MLGRRNALLALGGVAAAASLVGKGARAQDNAPLPTEGDSTLDAVRKRGTLRISTIIGAEPYFRKSAVDGTWSGAGIEMAKSMAGTLGVELEYVETTYSNAIIELRSGRIDVAFSLNPTPARALSIAFSNPYFEQPYVFLAKEDKGYKTWADVNKPEVRLAASTGTLPEVLVKRYAPEATIFQTKTIDDAVMGAQTGRADIIITAALQGLAIKGKARDFGSIVVPEAPRIALPTCFGVRPEMDPRWVNFLNSWVAMNRATGQIMEWIAVELERNGINRSEIPAEMFG